MEAIIQNEKPSNSEQRNQDIEQWIVSYVAKTLGISVDKIDVTAPFDRLGLDSTSAIAMTGDLEDWLGREIDPTLVYDYPTIQKLSLHLASASEQ